MAKIIGSADSKFDLRITSESKITELHIFASGKTERRHFTQQTSPLPTPIIVTVSKTTSRKSGKHSVTRNLRGPSEIHNAPKAQTTSLWG